MPPGTGHCTGLKHQIQRRQLQQIRNNRVATLHTRYGVQHHGRLGIGDAVKGKGGVRAKRERVDEGDVSRWD